MGEERNGSGSAPRGDGSTDPRSRSVEAPPPAVGELAEACVRFVERAVGIKLDYEPETLSVLDHYLEAARRDGQARPEALVVVAHAAGAYFGEVVRRRHASWWRVEGDDPNYWRVELEEVFLAVSPMQLVGDALARSEADEHREDDEGSPAGVEIDEDDREAIKARLADLPPVSDEEFYAPSTRLEVIDITVEAIRARRMASGSPTLLLGRHDYDAD